MSRKRKDGTEGRRDDPAISRQREYQKRNQVEGLCIICGKEKILASSNYCKYHYGDNKTRNRNAYRLKHQIPLDAPLWSRGKK